MDYLTARNFEAYAAGTAARAGVSVSWAEPDSVPCTDGRTIWIPKITSNADAQWFTRMRYYIKHETSHIVHSDFAYLNSVQPKGALALINNLLEDNRIDYRNDAEFMGDVVTSNAYWELYNDDVLNIDLAKVGQLRSVIAVFLLDAQCRSWIATASIVGNSLKTYATADNLAQLQLLCDNGCDEDLIALRTHTDNRAGSEAVFSLAKKIFSLLFPDVDVDSQYTSNASTDADGGEQGDGDGEDTPGKGASGDAGEEEGDSDDGVASTGEGIVDVSEISDMVHDHKPSRKGVHFIHEASTSGKGWTLPTKDERVVVDFPALHSEVSDHARYTTLNKSTVADIISNASRPLSNKLRIKLQTRSRDRYEYGHKRGKLHNGSLHRVLQGDVPSAEKVFRQRKVSDTLDTAVSLLVDCSGSMSGQKFDYACATAGAVSYALHPLHIQHSVMGFTNTLEHEHPLIWNFVKWGESVTNSELIKRFSAASGCLWQNSDGDAIAYAATQLSMRREARKVLIVLSDGSPAGRDWAGDASAYTLQTVRQVEASGIDVYGIGILDDNVTMYYTKHSVIRSIDKLQSAVLGVLDKAL